MFEELLAIKIRAAGQGGAEPGGGGAAQGDRVLGGARGGFAGGAALEVGISVTGAAPAR